MKLYIEENKLEIAKVLSAAYADKVDYSIGEMYDSLGLVEFGNQLWALIYIPQSGGNVYKLVDGYREIPISTDKANKLLIDAVNR